MPIHAAGIYGNGNGDKLLDYAVSSYTPTLTAISDLSAPKVGENFAILTIAQPSTPYATAIPKTEDEVKQVQSLAGNLAVVSLKNEEATVERVLQAMRDTDWVHMACHGKQNPSEPMESGLLLHDKILELSEIARHALPRADFAFLSACQTAVGDERIADESVHLAAGMFMAGYRGVIATMWSMRDEDGPKVAEDVYRRILKDGKPNRKEAARALHDAVKKLRDSGAGFEYWVPFIHLGR